MLEKFRYKKFRQRLEINIARVYLIVTEVTVIVTEELKFYI